MGDGADDTPARDRPSRSRFWLWTAFVTLCLAVGLGKPVYDLHWENQETLYDQAVLRERRAREDASTELWMRLYGMAGHESAAVEAVMGLAPGSLAAVPSDGAHVVELDGSRVGRDRGRVGDGPFTPPVPPLMPPKSQFSDAAGWRIKLVFRNGVFASATATPPPAPQPPSPAIKRALRQVVLWMLVLAPLVWLGGLLAGVAERNRRGTRFAEVALAAAVAGSAAWAAGFREFPIGPPPVGMITCAVGLLIALRTRRWLLRLERSQRFASCYACGYDLTGNESGVCPECGTETYAGRLRQRAALAAVEAESVAHVVADDGRAPGRDGEADDELDPCVNPRDDVGDAGDVRGVVNNLNIVSAAELRPLDLTQAPARR